MHQTNKMPPAIWAFAVTAFAIGVAEFIVVGILPSISADLHIPLAQTGNLVGLYALILAIGTPLLVLTTSRLPRKPLLLGLIALFMAGNLISALGTSYAILLSGRMLTAVAHGSFFAIGAMVAAHLVAEKDAGKAIALMFSGLTLAMVIGVPLGSMLGNGFGWRLPFFAVVVFAAMGLIATWLWVPSLPATTGNSIKAQLSALRRPPISVAMSVTILGFGSTLPAFTFITPLLTDYSLFTLQTANLLLIVFGTATLAGNLAGGHLSSRYGWQATTRMLLATLAIVLALIALLLRQQAVMTLLIFAWGALAFGLSPCLQAGMMQTARQFAPQALDFTSALNISSFNLGIALGQHLGSLLVERHMMAQTPWLGAAIALVAQLPLWWLGSKLRSNGQTAQQA